MAYTGSRLIAMATVNGLKTRITSTVMAKAIEVAIRPNSSNHPQSDGPGHEADHSPVARSMRPRTRLATASSRRETDSEAARWLHTLLSVPNRAAQKELMSASTIPQP